MDISLYSFEKALPYAMIAFESEKEHKDDQWYSLSQIEELLKKCSFEAIIENNRKSIFFGINEIIKFLEKKYEVDQLLDYYDPDYKKGIKKIIYSIHQSLEKYSLIKKLLACESLDKVV